MSEGEPIQIIVAGMGEIKVVLRPSGKQVMLKTTLGSCVGLFLADAKNDMYGLAHIMLPKKLSDDEAVGKYADTALPELVKQLTVRGDVDSMKAYIVGGASMFGPQSDKSVANIGRRNVDAVLEITNAYHIPVVYNDTGGEAGRTAIFSCRDSKITVKTLRKMGFSRDLGRRE